MALSTHRCEVFRIEEILPHPNADNLEKIIVFGGFPCLVQKGLWKVGDLAVYVPPDSVVPDTEQFAWLGDRKRIRAIRLRGEVSLGLITTVPEGAQEGDDVAAILGVVHYEPSIQTNLSTGGPRANPPPGFWPKYDVDALRRYKDIFRDGELVSVSEKLHGSSQKCVYVNNTLYIGGRNFWFEKDDKNIYWKAISNTPEVVEFATAHPNYIIYGECVPCQKGFHYGLTEPRMMVFDIMKPGGWWMSVEEGREVASALPWVPLITSDFIPYNFEELLPLAEGQSFMLGAKHIREGIVVRPKYERTQPPIGRVHLKLVGNSYLSTK